MINSNVSRQQEAPSDSVETRGRGCLLRLEVFSR
jgi:hypothetical protein